MSNLTKAADDARRILRGFKAFEEVAAALEQAGVAEQRQTEAEKLLADLQPHIEAAKMRRDEAVAQAEEVKTAAAAQAEQIVAAAQAKAQAIINDAQTAAVNADLHAEQVKAQAQALLAQAQAEVEGAQAKRNALAEECETLEKRIAKAQAQIAKILG